MNILNNYNNTNNSKLYYPQQNIKEQKNNSFQKINYKPDIIDILSSKVINPKDINDTVTVPRSIFKGYLSFTTGTLLSSIASMAENKKLSKYLNIIGCLLSVYGTYNFVKPYLLKQKHLTKNKN